MKTTKGSGTAFDDIQRINERLLPCIPSVRFVPEYPCEWEEIMKEYNESKPIIAWMWLSDNRDATGIRGCGHSVVIFDILPQGLICYNDPIHGVVSEDTGTFISKWEHEDVNRTLVKVKVGDRTQRDMSEYLIETIEGEEDEASNSR